MFLSLLFERRQTFIFTLICCCLATAVIPLSIWMASSYVGECTAKEGTFQIGSQPTCLVDDDCKMTCGGWEKGEKHVGVCHDKYNGNTTLACLKDSECDFGTCNRGGYNAALALDIIASVLALVAMALCCGGWIRHKGKAEVPAGGRPYRPLGSMTGEEGP